MQTISRARFSSVITLAALPLAWHMMGCNRDDASSSAKPRETTGGLKITPMERDLGRFGQGEEMKLAFQLKNESDAAISLKPPVASCTCSEVRLTSSTVKSQETESLSAVVRRDRAGPFSSTILVQPQRPELPATTIQIYGEVIQYYRIRGSWENAISPGSHADMPQPLGALPEITVLAEPPVLVVEIEEIVPQSPMFSPRNQGSTVAASSKFFTFSPPLHPTPGSNSGHSLKLYFKLKDAVKPGVYNDVLRVEAGSTVLTEPISFRVLGKAWVDTETANLGVLRSPTSPHVIRIRHAAGMKPWTNVKVDRVSPNVDASVVNVRSVKVGSDYSDVDIDVNRSFIKPAQDGFFSFSIALSPKDRTAKAEDDVLWAEVYGMCP